MSSSLKQVIVQAIVKVSTDPAYAGQEYTTPEAAREDFTKALLAELFPENPSVPVVKEKKKPGPKPKVTPAPPSPDSLAPPAEPEKEKEKKVRAPMSEEAKAAMVAKRKATMEAKKAVEPATPPKETPALPPSPPKAPKKAKKPAEPTPAGPVNLDKFTPTQKKKVKEIAGETVDVKDVLSYLNGLSNAAFHDKKLEDHFRDYAASLKPAEPEPEPEQETQTQEVDLVEVDFEGTTYAVNPETKRVYTVDENGNAEPVGYVGMAKFADMVLEDA